uniref:Uncharacterized protein n=1 Tax=Arundo donax TaxID=35708 RepID=A0A0A9FUE9_ARUDO
MRCQRMASVAWIRTKYKWETTLHHKAKSRISQHKAKSSA